MAQVESSCLRSEQELVAGLVEEELADLPHGLAQLVRSEMSEERVLAGVVLASAAPAHDSAEALSRRVALAAGLELLQIALNIHRLLLRPSRPDTIDSYLLGGTILAGDFCFSRAAVLAARTSHPTVVSVFAELLMELSQAKLRGLIGDACAFQDGGSAGERSSLFRGGAQAGGLLAGLSERKRTSVADFAARLSRCPGQAEEEPFGRSEDALARVLPSHQRERWRTLTSLLA